MTPFLPPSRFRLCTALFSVLMVGASTVHADPPSLLSVDKAVLTDAVDRSSRTFLHTIGTVHVNQYDEDDMRVPFGGYKQFGNGRDKSLHALDKYTELKTTWNKLA